MVMMTGAAQSIFKHQESEELLFCLSVSVTCKIRLIENVFQRHLQTHNIVVDATQHQASPSCHKSFSGTKTLVTLNEAGKPVDNVFNGLSKAFVKVLTNAFREN